MSFFSRFRRKFEQKTEHLEKYGILVYTNYFVSERTTTIGELKQQMKLMPIAEQLSILDQIIDTVGGPWGAGGDRPNYIKGYGSWHLYLGLFQSMFLTTEKEDKEMQMMLEAACVKHLLPYGWIVIENSWREKHLSPEHPIVIQSLAMPGSFRGPEDKPQSLALESLAQEEMMKRIIGEDKAGSTTGS